MRDESIFSGIKELKEIRLEKTAGTIYKVWQCRAGGAFVFAGHVSLPKVQGNAALYQAAKARLGL